MDPDARSVERGEVGRLRRRAFLAGVLGASAAAALGIRCAPAVATVPRKRRVAYLANRPAACVVPSEWRVTGGVATRSVNTPLPSGCEDPRRLILEELDKRGWRDGENLESMYTSPAKLAEEGGSDVPAFAAPAAALVALPVEIIVASGNAVMAAKQATKTIPIVISGIGDVVEAGVVPSLAHPGGNITGVSAEVVPVSIKRLEILKEAFPGVRRPLLVYGPSATHARSIARTVEVAEQIGLSVTPVQYTGSQPEFLAKASRALDEGADSLTMVGVVAVRPSVNALIRERRLPAVVHSNWIEDGAAAISLTSLEDYTLIAMYVDRILKGAYPGDLPIAARTLWELVVNLKTAREQGITISQSVMDQATRVIE